MLKDPSQANIIKLDPTLASLQTRVTNLLNRQAVQHPGECVVMKSSELSGLQDLVSALRNLGFVLPLLALLLYLAAIYLAKGWRREALIAAGGGILGADAAHPAGEAPDRQRGRRSVASSTRSSRPSPPSGTSFPPACASGRCSCS